MKEVANSISLQDVQVLIVIISSTINYYHNLFRSSSPLPKNFLCRVLRYIILFFLLLVKFLIGCFVLQDFLDDKCMTPDCLASVINVQIYDSEGLKTEVLCFAHCSSFCERLKKILQIIHLCPRHIKVCCTCNLPPSPVVVEWVTLLTG